ncbi:MAG: alpha-galactosidase [Pseudomonadota bacterium]
MSAETHAEKHYVRCDGSEVTLVFALTKGGAADLAYLGARLPDGENLAALVAAQRRALHESQPDAPPVPGLLPERKGGWSGTPAIELSHNGQRIETDFRVTDWALHAKDVTIDFADERWQIGARLTLEMQPSGVVDSSLTVFNYGKVEVTVDRLASIALPVPARFTEMTSFSGRWAGEMQESRRSIGPEGFARSSAIGKQGFGGGNWLLLHDPDTGETLDAHLEWSGDYETLIECDAQGAGDGRAMLQMGARYDRGEIVLKPGDAYDSPAASLALGSDRSTLAQTLQREVRENVAPMVAANGPRLVHCNSWEAVGFDLSQPDLFELARSAAALGIERFVLDDGWFAGRRDDTSSLGDWIVSSDVFPAGLTPLIDHFHANGMDFGLWVEPEMVSPDSDLYRAHPDWCIHIESAAQPTMRSQLVLDLSREDVWEYVFDRLEALLSTHPIAYLKWDHNRDLFPVAGRGMAQTEALYRLLGAIRSDFPQLEIESCSSGGGRIDYGVLSHTHRVWPSDNNDPIERLRIIRAWSQFLPLEVLGSHVGPSPNPITGRRTAMDFRAKVALFGHMGVEADPRAMSEDERRVLAAHIALYKEWRGVLHAGELWRLEHPDPGISGLMVTHEAKALALIAQTRFAAQFDVAPVRLAGLDPQARYRVTLPEPWPAKASGYLAEPERWREGMALSGRALMTQGLALPLTYPETAWLIALERLDP